GHRNTVDHRLGDAAAGSDGFRYLGGRDILALPAEGVADAVDEIEEAAGILAHQVAGAEPRIADGEDVAQYFFRRRVGVGIALERAAVFRSAVGHLADRLADLVGGAPDAETVIP